MTPTIHKYVAYIPLSWELIFDVIPYKELNMEGRKAWFRLGHGLGSRTTKCKFPLHQLTRHEFYLERRLARWTAREESREEKGF